MKEMITFKAYTKNVVSKYSEPPAVAPISKPKAALPRL